MRHARQATAVLAQAGVCLERNCAFMTMKYRFRLDNLAKMCYLRYVSLVIYLICGLSLFFFKIQRGKITGKTRIKVPNITIRKVSRAIGKLY